MEKNCIVTGNTFIITSLLHVLDLKEALNNYSYSLQCNVLLGYQELLRHSFGFFKPPSWIRGREKS